MAKPPKLIEQAAEFAQYELGEVLNKTITNGIRIGAALLDSGPCLIGYGVTKKNFIPKPIPLTVDAKAPRCYLDLHHFLRINPLGFLVVEASSTALLLGPESESPPVFRYDFDRHPDNDYPLAHFQVEGVSDSFNVLAEKAGRERNELGKLHFPVGGKRYRPSLEDVIEFLIVEKLVDRRDGWRAILDEHRNEFHRKQLRAAVMADPDTAREALELADEQTDADAN